MNKNSMNKKIKLLIITHTFPTKYNPVAATFLLNQLVELKKYCDIKIIFPHAYVPKIKILNPYYRFSDVTSFEKIKGLNVYHPKYLMIPRILFKLKLLHLYIVIESFFSYFASKKIAYRIMNEWNPDIIHMHGTISEGLLGLKLKKDYKKPLLVTLYGDDINRYAKQIPSNYLSKLILKNVDGIICQSKFLENETRGIGIHDKKFFIIPMGALTGKFKPKNQNKVRKILNLPENKKIVLFVGHLAVRKGVEHLIRAFGIVLKKEKDVLCYIIGKGYSERDLKSLASGLKLGEYIKFLGSKANEEVALYMNACDLFVLPSLNEGLPVVLCEALACGKPVVATNVAGTPELVNEDVGYLVKPKDVEDLADKIVLALNKRWDIHKLLKRGNEFSVSNSAKKLIKVYKSFLKGK